MAGTLDPPIFRGQPAPGGVLSQRDVLAPADGVTDVSLFDTSKTGPLDSPAIAANPVTTQTVQGVDASPPDATPAFKVTGAIVPRGVPLDLTTAPMGSTLPPANGAEVDKGNVVVSAFRQGNPIVSAFANQEVRDGAPDPSFNSIEDILGTKYEPYADRFAAGAFNRPQAAALKAQIDMEEADKRTLAAGGFGGWVASLGAGLLDPTNLLPMGEIAKGAKLGTDAVRSALSVGAAAGGSALASELMLHGSQETRTVADSAFAIGGSIMFGAFLGGAGSGFSHVFSAGERAALSRRLYEDMTAPTPDMQAGNETLIGDAIDRLTANPPAEGEHVAGVGAEASARPTLAGESPTGLGDVRTGISTAWINASAALQLNPIVRLLTSPSALVRRLGSSLYEGAIYTAKNLGGEASPQAVETLTKRWNQGAVQTALRAGTDAFRDYRRAGGTLTQPQFMDEVGKAMRRDDQHEIPQVAASAKAWRSQVVEPLKKLAIESGLLPPDVKVTEAASYFSRLWDRRKIDATDPTFRAVISSWAQRSVKAEVERLTANRDARIGALNQHIADLEATPEESARLLKDLPAQLKALQEGAPHHVATGMALERLRAQSADATAATQVHPLRSPADRAALAAKAAAANEDIQRIVKDAGKDYADFVTKRNLLESRIRRVRGNLVGRESQTEQIRSQIAYSEWKNIDRLWRMHKALGKLENAIERTSPEAVASQLSDLRTEFGQVQEKSAKANDRLAASVARREKEAQAAAASGDTAKAAEIDAELKRETPFMAEAQREEEMNTLARRIGELEDVDPEEAVAEFKSLLEKRINRASEMVENEARRMDMLAAKLKASDPKIGQAKAAELRQRIADVHRKYNDRVDVGLDAANNHEGYVNEVANSVINQLTGRRDTAGPHDLVAASRGPLKERTLHIPDELVEPWLNNNAEEVNTRYARVMSAEIELSKLDKRFGGEGTADLKGAFKQIMDHYAELRAAVPEGPNAGAQRLALADREKADRRDLEAGRDMIRGTYLAGSGNTSYARTLAGINAFNYLRTMGSVVKSSLTDIARPIMVHGMSAWLADGIGPLVANLKGFRLSQQEAREAGTVGEAFNHSRLSTWMELNDPYATRTPFEGLLQNTTRGFSKLTGINLWTDFGKSIASTMTQARILRAAQNFDAASAKDKAYMNMLGLGASERELIARQFAAHGETLNGLPIANAGRWGVGETGSAAIQAERARTAYYAALNKDVDSIIVTKGLGDSPLWAHTPTGRAVTQFGSYAMAANQRATIRGLQEGHAGFVSGAIATVAIGMFQYWLGEVAANRKVSDNPGHWIAEGLDQSGLMTSLFQINNTVEKVTGMGAYAALEKVFPGQSQGGKASRFYDTGIAGALGPTGDFANTALKIVGIARDGKLTASDISAIRQMLPGATLPVIRQILSYYVEPQLKQAVGPASRTATIH